jgi:hypothetical protein
MDMTLVGTAAAALVIGAAVGWFFKGRYGAKAAADETAIAQELAKLRADILRDEKKP